MLKNIFSTKPSKKINKASDTDLQQAAAVLMLKMAGADGTIDHIELAQVVKLLQKEFKLDSSKLNEVVTLASNKNILYSPVEEFTDRICASFGKAKRVKLLEYLWILAYVDDKIDSRETELIQRVARLLTLNDLEIAQAQENAEDHLGLNLF